MNEGITKMMFGPWVTLTTKSWNDVLANFWPPGGCPPGGTLSPKTRFLCFRIWASWGLPAMASRRKSVSKIGSSACNANRSIATEDGGTTYRVILLHCAFCGPCEHRLSMGYLGGRRRLTKGQLNRRISKNGL